VEESLARESDATIFPGMMFSLAKDLMESTKLWEIVRRMPKGALLHAHMDAMVDFDFVFSVLLSLPGMHISASASLSNAAALADASLEFRYRNTANESGNIWRADYEPETFVLLTKAADDFPDGAREGFIRWLKSRCTISQTDGLEQHHGIDAIWRKFAKCFRVMSTILHYEPMFRAFLKRLMSSLYADGVSWVELRYRLSGCLVICI
jgi:adenosine deaminase CECR1